MISLLAFLLACLLTSLVQWKMRPASNLEASC